jgi:uncharacterized repeat protein (TIGR03833 family)
MAGTRRNEIHPGDTVDIVLKQDQRTGKLTRGVVKELLTGSQFHPHGIKVRLVDGKVGRVKAIIPKGAAPSPAKNREGGTTTNPEKRPTPEKKP